MTLGFRVDEGLKCCYTGSDDTICSALLPCACRSARLCAPRQVPHARRWLQSRTGRPATPSGQPTASQRRSSTRSTQTWTALSCRLGRVCVSPAPPAAARHTQLCQGTREQPSFLPIKQCLSSLCDEFTLHSQHGRHNMLFRDDCILLPLQQLECFSACMRSRIVCRISFQYCLKPKEPHCLQIHSDMAASLGPLSLWIVARIPCASRNA